MVSSSCPILEWLDVQSFPTNVLHWTQNLNFRNQLLLLLVAPLFRLTLQHLRFSCLSCSYLSCFFFNPTAPPASSGVPLSPLVFPCSFALATFPAPRVCTASPAVPPAYTNFIDPAVHAAPLALSAPPAAPASHVPNTPDALVPPLKAFPTPLALRSPTASSHASVPTTFLPLLVFLILVLFFFLPLWFSCFSSYRSCYRSCFSTDAATHAPFSPAAPPDFPASPTLPPTHFLPVSTDSAAPPVSHASSTPDALVSLPTHRARPGLPAVMLLLFLILLLLLFFRFLLLLHLNIILLLLILLLFLILFLLQYIYNKVKKNSIKRAITFRFSGKSFYWSVKHRNSLRDKQNLVVSWHELVKCESVTRNRKLHRYEVCISNRR